MKIDPATKKQITKNVALSLLIYALPIVLMFITFSVNGQKPWEKKTVKKENIKSIINKSNITNGSND
jgi:hypothetical protein